MTTNVPPVTFGNTGFVVPSPEAILTGVIADYQAAFAGNLNLSIASTSSLSTPQGQLASSEAAVIGNVYATFLYQSTQTDPAFAQGRWQDAIGRIYFIERYPALPTVLQITCSGGAGVDIPVSALITDTSGNVYTATTGGTITSLGTVVLPFANLVPGPIAIPATNDVSIYQAIPGWDSVAVSSGELGQNVESRSAFETRRAQTVAGNSFGAIGSIIGAVSEVTGVSDYWGYDNGTSAPVTVQGVTVAANSIYVSVAGGTEAAVAEAILSKKSGGCGMSGNTTVTAYDNNPLYSAPIPYSITYEIPGAVQVAFAVDIVAGPLVPSNAAALVQAAIINAFAGGDGGPRARIGGTILATRFIPPIAALGPWALVRTLTLGANFAATSQFTGVIAGTALTTSGAIGTIAIGQTLIDVSGSIAPNTTITAGSGSSWTVSPTQSVSSETMWGILVNQSSLTVNANDLPEVLAANIVVTIA